MPYAFPHIQYFFEKKLADLATWKAEYDEAVERSKSPLSAVPMIDQSKVIPLEVDESRVVPLIPDESRVVPLTPDESRVVPIEIPEEWRHPMASRLEEKLAASLEGAVITIPEDLEPYMENGPTYIVLRDLKNVGLISTR